MRLTVAQLAFDFGVDWVLTQLYNQLRNSALRFRNATEYHDYLDYTLRYFDFHYPYRRLLDEEGRERLQGSPVTTLARAAEVIAGDTSAEAAERADIFADWVDKYAAVCLAEGFSAQQRNDLLAGNASRSALSESVEDARAQIREMLFVFLMNWGARWVQTRLAEAVQNLGSKGDLNYRDCFNAALTYFEILGTYGLLADAD